MIETREMILPVLLTRHPALDINAALAEIAWCKPGISVTLKRSSDLVTEVVQVLSPREICMGWIPATTLHRLVVRAEDLDTIEATFNRVLIYGFSIRVCFSCIWTPAKTCSVCAVMVIH